MLTTVAHGTRLQAPVRHASTETDGIRTASSQYICYRVVLHAVGVPIRRATKTNSLKKGTPRGKNGCNETVLGLRLRFSAPGWVTLKPVVQLSGGSGEKALPQEEKPDVAKFPPQASPGPAIR